VSDADLIGKLTLRRIPRRFHEPLTRGGELPTAALDAVKRLIMREGFLLVLSGPAGCGKSFAAAWALSKMIGYWVHAPDLARPQEDGEHPKDDRMKDAPLLVLDDVGVEHSPSQYGIARLVDVVVYRESQLLPVIVTTNLDAEEFSKRYGDRVASRVNGDRIGFQTVAGDDLRLGLALTNVATLRRP